jgi:hypothetical protein
MANHKKIIRDKVIFIKVSTEEKKLFDEYAKKLDINPSRLARNLLLQKAESGFKNIEAPVIKAYKHYLKITNQEDISKLE